MKQKPDQDSDLFRSALEGVVPLPPPDRIIPARKLGKVRITACEFSPVSDNLSDHGAGDVAINEFLRPGLNRLTLRKLRHGTWRIQDELDLHGLSKDDARHLLMKFLQEATQRNLRCVNVIHGKGWRNDRQEGVLKIHTRHWLTQHPQVLAFCEAPPQAGGGGAVWVLLKNNKL